MSEPRLVLTRPDGTQVPASEIGLSEDEQSTIVLMLKWLKRWTLLCWRVRAWLGLFLSSMIGSRLFLEWEFEAEVQLRETIIGLVGWGVFPCIILIVFVDAIWMDHQERKKTTGEEIRAGLVTTERAVILAIPCMMIDYSASIYYSDLGWGLKALGVAHLLVCMHAGVEVNAICYLSRKMLESINEAIGRLCIRNRPLGRPCACPRCRPISAAQAA